MRIWKNSDFGLLPNKTTIAGDTRMSSREARRARYSETLTAANVPNADNQGAKLLMNSHVSRSNIGARKLKLS